MPGGMQKKENKKENAVSPVNGQPLPRGRQFTSETAREARRKRTIKEQNQRSITEAFKKRMGDTFTDKSGRTMTGAEVMAESIINGASNGNAKMIEIALAIMGETPTHKVELSSGHMDEIINSLREPYDIHAEAAAIIGGMADKST